MSRVKADSTKTPRKAPRKRAVRRVAPKEEVIPRKVVKEVKEVEVSRKAPSRIVSKEKSKRGSKKIMIIAGVLLVGFGAAAFIGNSDSGQINIATVIEERNKQIASGNAASEDSSSGSTATIPVQNTAPPSVPNGGLRGRGVGTPKVNQAPVPVVPKEVVPVGTSTATSTNETATTTEETAEIKSDEITEEEEVTEEAEVEL